MTHELFSFLQPYHKANTNDHMQWERLKKKDTDQNVLLKNKAQDNEVKNILDSDNINIRMSSQNRQVKEYMNHIKNKKIYVMVWFCMLL